jgi:hypothetical protein
MNISMPFKNDTSAQQRRVQVHLTDVGRHSLTYESFTVVYQAPRIREQPPVHLVSLVC